LANSIQHMKIAIEQVPFQAILDLGEME